MKRLCMILIFSMLAIVGCSKHEKEIDDSAYNFVSYITYDSYRNEYGVLDAEGMKQLRDRTDKDSTAVDGSSRIQYAVDKNNVLYQYAIEKNEEGDRVLNCPLVFPEEVSATDFFILDEDLYIATSDGQLYQLRDKTPEIILSNIAAIKIFPDKDYSNDNFIIYTDNVGILNNEASLYMMGFNTYGQMGNGYSGYSATFGADESCYEPVGILENVKEFDIDITPENYYKGAAITNDNKLYVWGALPYSEEIVTLSDGNGSSFEKTVTSENPDQQGYDPIEKLDNVESFEFGQDGIIATTGDGEEVLVKEVSTEDEDTSEVSGESDDKWDDVFDSILINLEESYYNDCIERVRGVIQNNTDEMWKYIEIEIELYDDYDICVGTEVVKLHEDLLPGDTLEFETEDIYLYYGTKYKVISITPYNLG